MILFLFFIFKIKGDSYEDLNVTRMCVNGGGYCFPRIIWAYWDKVETIPEDIQEMINVTKNTLLGRITHEILTEENVTGFLDFSTFPDYYKQLGSANKADYLRVRLLEKYGGVWIDASTFITSVPEMEWFFSKAIEKRPQLISFAYPWNKMSPNFFGAPENSIIMKRFREQYDIALNDEDPKEYVKELCRQTRPHDCRFYILIDHVYAKVLHDNHSLKTQELLLPASRSQYRLDQECHRVRDCIQRRLRDDPKVRKYAFIKMQGKNRLGKKIDFYNVPTKEFDYSIPFYKPPRRNKTSKGHSYDIVTPKKNQTKRSPETDI